MTFSTSSKRKQVRGTPDSCAQRPTSSRSSRTFSRDVPLCVGNRPRKRLTTALNLAAAARWAEPEASTRRAVQPTGSSPRAREGARRLQASSAPSRGCSTCSVRQDDRLPARADHHLLPRRGPEHFKAGPRPLQVAICRTLRQPLAARTEEVFCCGLDVHGRKFRVLIRLGAGWSCAAAGSKNVKVFGCPNGPCGYDSETILRYMAELNILGSLWLAGIC